MTDISIESDGKRLTCKAQMMSGDILRLTLWDALDSQAYSAAVLKNATSGALLDLLNVQLKGESRNKRATSRRPTSRYAMLCCADLSRSKQQYCDWHMLGLTILGCIRLGPPTVCQALNTHPCHIRYAAWNEQVSLSVGEAALILPCTDAGRQALVFPEGAAPPPLSVGPHTGSFGDASVRYHT